MTPNGVIFLFFSFLSHSKSFTCVLDWIRSQPRYVQTQPAVSRLVYLGQFCTN